MIEILPLRPADARQVANLHIQYLRTPFQGKPGLELLRVYYLAIAPSGGGCGYVVKGPQEILGYVCGVFDPDRIRKYLIKYYFFHLAAWGSALLLTHPRTLLGLISRLVQRNPTQGPKMVGYELRPIVVSPAARGTQVSMELVNALLEDAARRGYGQIYLFAGEDNLAANRFYQKAGFRRVNHFVENDQGYFCYERQVSPTL